MNNDKLGNNKTQVSQSTKELTSQPLSLMCYTACWWEFHETRSVSVTPDAIYLYIYSTSGQPVQLVCAHVFKKMSLVRLTGQARPLSRTITWIKVIVHCGTI